MDRKRISRAPKGIILVLLGDLDTRNRSRRVPEPEEAKKRQFGRAKNSTKDSCKNSEKSKINQKSKKKTKLYGERIKPEVSVSRHSISRVPGSTNQEKSPKTKFFLESRPERFHRFPKMCAIKIETAKFRSHFGASYGRRLYSRLLAIRIRISFAR